MSEILSNHKKTIEAGSENWAKFLEKRERRLIQMQRPDGGAEKVAECILEDLLTVVLDWGVSDINYQMRNCDIVLTKMGIKYALIETKYPGQFSNKSNIDKALLQASEYARRDSIKKIVISDGYKLFLTDFCLETNLTYGWLDISLDSPTFPPELWHLSVHGIYRPLEKGVCRMLSSPADENALLHHKYKLPSACFAYVGDIADTKTWKLPYLEIDGSVDSKRLPKAISAVISNYRGTKVKGISEKAIPLVLKKLEAAARKTRKMPDQNPRATETFVQLANIFSQLEPVL